MYEKELSEHKESASFYNTLTNFSLAGFVVLFFLGILSSKVVIFFSLISLGLGLVFMNKRDKHSQAIRDIEHKQRMKKLDERLNAYNSVKDIASAAYHKVCDMLRKPEHTYHIEVFANESFQEICEQQAEGDWWKTLTRPCECWIDMKSKEHNIGSFCLLETFENFDAKVSRLPDFFKSDEEAFRNVWRKCIPFSDILYYTIIGDVSVTSSVSGGDATYHGVTVNGIGFGEWDVDPIQIHHKEHDQRMVTLLFTDCGEECSLFFPVGMLPRLRLLIRQFEK